MRFASICTVFAALVACGGSEEAPAPAEPAAEPAAAPADGHDDHAHEAAAPGEAAPAAHKVFFVEPVDGAKVKSPVKVVFGVEGMEIEPAGEVKPNKGHHHVIIDGQPVPAGTAVPVDANHIHFGKGQTETTVELTPGEHTLTMQFADGAHMSYGPEMATTVKVTVE